jgi:uncharacterized protein YecE (DUF72 family)
VDVRIGISGWTYAPWRGRFYPRGLGQRNELAYVAERMNSVEINGSFYSLQRRSSYEAWSAAVPDDFIFSVKGGRFITHMKKLAGIETPLANFLASGMLALGRKLGPILWQLPPTLGFDSERVEAFFELLPRTTGAAAAIAVDHDQRVPADRALTAVADPAQRIRHAVEVRHDTFRTNEFYELLRRQQIALVVADSPGKWPFIEEITTDFMYVRLHGHDELYTSGYSDESLDEWATKTRNWVAAGQDVYIYCDNDAKVRAPYDAMGLMQRLGLSAPPSGDKS